MAAKKKTQAPRSNENSMSIIGSKLNFEGREAYNLLRTNLMFATKRNDRNARVIGITSSVHGEGKSLTVINLAYSIAESGRKVILVECDLRLPTLRKKLNLPKSTGVSNILAGINNEKATLHRDVLIKGLDITCRKEVQTLDKDISMESSLLIVDSCEDIGNTCRLGQVKLLSQCRKS